MLATISPEDASGLEMGDLETPAAAQQRPAWIDENGAFNEAKALAAVSVDGYQIGFIAREHRTDAMRLAAVRENGRAIWHLDRDERTDEMRMAAVMQNAWALNALSPEERTPQLNFAAVRVDGELVRRLAPHELTQEICLAAVSSCWLGAVQAMAFMPDEKRTPMVWKQALETLRAGPYCSMTPTFEKRCANFIVQVTTLSAETGRLIQNELHLDDIGLRLRRVWTGGPAWRSGLAGRPNTTRKDYSTARGRRLVGRMASQERKLALEPMVYPHADPGLLVRGTTRTSQRPGLAAPSVSTQTYELHRSRVASAVSRLQLGLDRIAYQLKVHDAGAHVHAGWDAMTGGGSYFRDHSLAVVWVNPDRLTRGGIGSGCHWLRTVVAHEVGHHEEASFDVWSFVRGWSWRPDEFPKPRGLGAHPSQMTLRARSYGYGLNVSPAFFPRANRANFDAREEHFAEAYAWLRCVSSQRKPDAHLLRDLSRAAQGPAADAPTQRQAAAIYPRVQAKLARTAEEIELFLRHQGRGLGAARRRRLAIALSKAREIRRRRGV